MWPFYKKTQANNLLIWFLLLLIAELASWLSFNVPVMGQIFLLGLDFFLIWAVFKKPEYALYVSLAELFWGGVGHSFESGYLNARLFIFIAIFTAFFLKYEGKFGTLKIIKDKRVFRVWLAILAVCAVSVLVAFFNGQVWTDIFFDGNAYLYVLYLPIWYELYSSAYLKNIVTILTAAALVLAVKTLLVFNIFAQDYAHLDTTPIYKWIRDTRTGEITPFSQNFWRVFMPAQLFVLFAWVMVFIKQLGQRLNYKTIIYLAILSAALHVSLSRSFWLGGVIAVLMLLVNFIIFKKYHFDKSPWLTLLPVAMVAVVLVEIFFNVPHWRSYNIFTKRSADISESAVSSRLQLLPVMSTAIAHSPLIGYGFGHELSYRSNDPRIKTVDNLEGWHSTYAFEWGWLDQWVKGGLLLVACFILWILLIFSRAYRALKFEPVRALAVISVLCALVVIHVFSPYLNHPLGIGVLMLMTIIFPYHE